MHDATEYKVSDATISSGIEIVVRTSSDFFLSADP